jgi:hypothetical protein
LSVEVEKGLSMRRYFAIVVTVLLGSGLLLWNSAAGIDDIIVETGKQGKNAEFYKELSGEWAESIAKSRADGLSARAVGSRFVSTDTPASAQAIFQPVIPQAGQWEISVTWGMSANANHAKYIVFDGKTEHVRYLDQAGWGGELPANQDRWHSLGSFNLPAGSIAYVKVDTSEVTGKSSPADNGRVYADAIRLHLENPAPAASASPSPTPAAVLSTPTPVAVVATPTPDMQSSEIFATPTGAAPASPTPALGPEAEWLSDYAKALGEGKRRNRYILIFFHYPPAADSQRMNDEVMRNPKVVDEMSRFVCCRLNPVEAQQIANYYTVVKAPVVLVLDPNGYLRGRQDGYVMAVIFLNFLSQFR